MKNLSRDVTLIPAGALGSRGTQRRTSTSVIAEAVSPDIARALCERQGGTIAVN
jgi:hypothetical protein